MKRSAKLAAILTVGATSAVGVVIATGPVSAAAGGNGTTQSGTGTGGYSRMMGPGGAGYRGMTGTNGNGTGTGTGIGMMGRGATGTGTGAGTGMMGANGVGMMGTLAVTAPSGTLSAAQKSALAQLAEQQQLAQNLYQAFADRYGSIMFDHLADAAGYQLDALRTLTSRYGISDPTAGKSTGTFSDPATQATYNRLLAQGQAGYTSALSAARTVTTTQVSTLTADLTGLNAPDVQQVYTRLLNRAQMHQAMLTGYTN